MYYTELDIHRIHIGWGHRIFKDFRVQELGLSRFPDIWVCALQDFRIKAWGPTQQLQATSTEPNVLPTFASGCDRLPLFSVAGAVPSPHVVLGQIPDN